MQTTTDAGPTGEPFDAGQPVHRGHRRGRGGRRTFLRHATGAALAVFAAGTTTILSARPAAALDDGCCLLALNHSPWCPHYCQEAGATLRCWSCNDLACRCCECILSGIDRSCWSFGTVYNLGCSNYSGCCF